MANQETGGIHQHCPRAQANGGKCLECHQCEMVLEMVEELRKKTGTCEEPPVGIGPDGYRWAF